VLPAKPPWPSPARGGAAAQYLQSGVSAAREGPLSARRAIYYLGGTFLGLICPTMMLPDRPMAAAESLPMTEPPLEDIPKLLVPDPQRQAHDKIRGYVYQVWQSVLAWIDLGEDETLALEGGEDFDILGAEAAQANQVKALARNITLRSEDVVEAIRNFWELKAENKGRRLTFRFLTTAQAGVETKSPFGDRIPGIEHWRQAAQTGSGIGHLRSLLREQKKLGETLLKFLGTASDEEIRTELLQPVEWWLGLEPTDGIKAEVESKLIHYGEKRNILAHDSEKVAPHLLEKAFATATSRDARTLRNSDFIKIFDEATSKRISPSEALAVATMFPQQLLSLLPGGAQPPVDLGSYGSISAPPPLPPRLAQRERLAAGYRNVLASTGGLVLMGSTGMGKSTLAKLLSGSPWLWANLRPGPATNTSAILAQLVHRLHNSAEPILEGIVFDDYSPDTPDESPMARLLHTLRARGTGFIITTAKPLPSRLAANLELESSSFQVPGLSRSEVEDWLRACGCPPELVPEQARFLTAFTSGHPQLLHAQIEHRLRTGWREIEPEDLIETPSGAAQVRMEARELLRRLPEATRTLAYRLSMAIQPFRRDHALAISQPAPQVPLPGESFDSLIGPWIEQLTDQYFRVSPLLSGFAQDVFPTGELQSLHKAWGETFLITPPLSHTEAVGSFSHAFLGQDLQTLLAVAYALLNSRESVQKAAFASLHWFATIGVAAPMPGFIPESEKRLPIRILQYHLAEEPEQRRRIAAIWDEESRSFPLENEDRRPVYRYMFLLSVFIDRNTRHEISRLFSWLQEMANLVERLRPLYPDLVESIEKGPKDDKLGDTAAAFLLTIVVQCGTMEDLSALLNGLEGLEEQLRGRALRLFSALSGTATSLIDRCWLAEKEAAQPDWKRCLNVLERAQRLGKAWSCSPLREAAARGKILVWNETGTDAALDALAGEDADLRKSALLLDLKAALLQDRNEHEAALAIWQEGLGRWTENEELGEVNLVYAYRKAAISVGSLGRWTEAARFFWEAFTRLHDYFSRHTADPKELALSPVELLADHAFSLWRAGQGKASLESFAEVIGRVSALRQELATSDRYNFLTKVLRAMFLWLTGHSSAVVPFPGAASSSQKSPEGSLDLPPTSIDALWALLCLLELKAGVQGGILERAHPRLAHSTDALAGYMFKQATLGRRLRLGDLEGLPSAVLAWMEELFEQRDQAPSASERLGLLLRILEFGLLSFSRHRPDLIPPWEEWRSFVEANFPEHASLTEPWFRYGAETFAMSPGSLTKILRSRGTDPRYQFCMVRAAAGRLAPEPIFVAQVGLVLSIRSSLFNEVVGYLISDVVEAQWRRLAEIPALLINPRLNVPAIREAYNLEDPGLVKASAILLAATPAVNVTLGEEQKQALRAITQEVRSHIPR
jgi:hypothetical protein